MASDSTDSDDAETGESADGDETETIDDTATTEATPAERPSTVVETQTGLDENVAAALSYLLGPLTGILFYLLEEENRFVRFHAAQSTIVFGGLFVLGIALSIATTILAIIPIIGWLFALFLGLGAMLLTPIGFLAWLFLMYKAYSGDEYEVPYAGEYARRYAPTDVDPLAGDTAR